MIKIRMICKVRQVFEICGTLSYDSFDLELWSRPSVNRMNTGIDIAHRRYRAIGYTMSGSKDPTFAFFQWSKKSIFFKFHVLHSKMIETLFCVLNLQK